MYRLTGGLADVTVRLGRGAAVYNGRTHAVWFAGMKGTGGNPWQGTALSALEFGQEDVMEGTLSFRTGDFFVSSTSTLTLPNGELSFNVTFRDTSISADVRGSARWTGSATIDGFGASCTARADVSGSLKIGVAGSALVFAGSLDAGGRIRCYVGGQRVASAGFHIGGRINNDEVEFDLPYIGNVSLDLP